MTETYSSFTLEIGLLSLRYRHKVRFQIKESIKASLLEEIYYGHKQFIRDNGLKVKFSSKIVDVPSTAIDGSGGENQKRFDFFISFRNKVDRNLFLLHYSDYFVSLP